VSVSRPVIKSISLCRDGIVRIILGLDSTTKLGHLRVRLGAESDSLTSLSDSSASTDIVPCDVCFSAGGRDVTC
jgi:hypothetical protein